MKIKRKKKSARSAGRPRQATTPETPPAVSKAFAAVMAVFAKDKNVTARKMFASTGLNVKGKFFAIEHKGSLVVKLPKAKVDALVADGVGDHFDPGHGRPMKEWIAVPKSRVRQWAGLARESMSFVKSL